MVLQEVEVALMHYMVENVVVLRFDMMDMNEHNQEHRNEDVVQRNVVGCMYTSCGNQGVQRGVNHVLL